MIGKNQDFGNLFWTVISLCANRTLNRTKFFWGSNFLGRTHLIFYNGMARQGLASNASDKRIKMS